MEVNSGELTKQQAIFKYLMILNRDLQLPVDLLSEDWKGEEAYKIYKKVPEKKIILQRVQRKLKYLLL